MDQNLKRLISGILIILSLSIIFSLFLMVFYVSAADVQRMKKLMAMDAQQKDVPGPAAQIPTISRYKFSLKLPVVGQKDRYHWIIKGGFSRSIDADKDRISSFDGTFFSENGEPMVLKSPIVTFDKSKLVLTSRDRVFLDLSWSRNYGRGFLLDMENRFCKIFEDSHSTIEKSKASASPMFDVSQNQSDTENSNDTVTDDDKPDENIEKPKKTGILKIEAKELYYFMDKNRVLYKNKVFVWDTSGIIKADRMEVFNYSDEEKAENPEHSGVREIICTGNVKIDQGTKWAIGNKAVFDKATNVVTLTGTARKRAVYWEFNSDRTEVHRFAGDIIRNNRNTNDFEVVTTVSETMEMESLLASEVDKVKILGFDSKKFGLFTSDTSADTEEK